MTTPSEFDDIRNFFSSYFHEDWSLDAPDPAGIVTQYVAHQSDAGSLRRQAAQIRLFMRAHPDDSDLERALFSELGAYYVPSADNISPRQWLEDVASMLDTAASTPKR